MAIADFFSCSVKCMTFLTTNHKSYIVDNEAPATESVICITYNIYRFFFLIFHKKH